jgi:hypothetical protein
MDLARKGKVSEGRSMEEDPAGLEDCQRGVDWDLKGGDLPGGLLNDGPGLYSASLPSSQGRLALERPYKIPRPSVPCPSIRLVGPGI